jgi:hypothetical protein
MNQTQEFTRCYHVDGEPRAIVATVQHDDRCRNGHNTFSITGEIYTPRCRRGEKTINAGGQTLYLESCGCIHEEIAERIPELAPFIKWHLCGTNGPMHYIANTMHHAGDRDCWGRRPGEPFRFEYGVRFNDVPVTHTLKTGFYDWLQEHYAPGKVFSVVGIPHKGSLGTHYTLSVDGIAYGDEWHDCPFDHEAGAEEFALALANCHVDFVAITTEVSKGKPRDLDAARRAAIWPDATDEELTEPGLEQRLRDRLPALLAEFRAAVESLGLVY